MSKDTKPLPGMAYVLGSDDDPLEIFQKPPNILTGDPPPEPPKYWLICGCYVYSAPGFAPVLCPCKQTKYCQIVIPRWGRVLAQAPAWVDDDWLTFLNQLPPLK